MSAAILPLSLQSSTDNRAEVELPADKAPKLATGFELHKRSASNELRKVAVNPSNYHCLIEPKIG